MSSTCRKGCDAAALHDDYATAQVTNIRKWSRRCFAKGKSTVDRVVCGPHPGIPPLAARWHDKTKGVYTIAVLRQEKKRGTAHHRIVIVSEQTHQTAVDANRAWADVAAGFARHGCGSLEDTDAQEAIRVEIVEGSYGCLWRMPSGDDADGTSSSGEQSISDESVGPGQTEADDTMDLDAEFENLGVDPRIFDAYGDDHSMVSPAAPPQVGTHPELEPEDIMPLSPIRLPEDTPRPLTPIVLSLDTPRDALGDVGALDAYFALAEFDDF